MLQAMRSVDAGVAPRDRRGLVAFGMPMGPLELADTVGLDIARAAGEELAGGQEPRCLADRLSRGQLGRKTGQGFYAWRDGKPVKDKASPPPPASRPA